jgi:transcriptional regulator with XRE-family HTH domain
MTQTPWRTLRETTGLSLSEISRRTGINKGRLSIIERGVPPSEDEARRIRAAILDGYDVRVQEATA